MCPSHNFIIFHIRSSITNVLSQKQTKKKKKTLLISKEQTFEQGHQLRRFSGGSYRICVQYLIKQPGEKITLSWTANTREWISRAPRGRSPRQGRRARWSLFRELPAQLVPAPVGYTTRPDPHPPLRGLARQGQGRSLAQEPCTNPVSSLQVST